MSEFDEAFWPDESPDEGVFVPDMSAVAAASQQLADAEEALRAATERLAAAEDAAADAEGDEEVAQAKYDDYAADDRKQAWQVTAAASDLAKKSRALNRGRQRLTAAQAAHAEASAAASAARVALNTAWSTAAPEDGEGVQLMVTQLPLAAPPQELVEWVEGTLQDTLTSLGKTEARWCAQWAEHPEAVHRLAGMFDEWQLMIVGSTRGPSLHGFIRDVLDYHLPHLVSTDYGAFARCGEDYGHEQHRRLDGRTSAIR